MAVIRNYLLSVFGVLLPMKLIGQNTADSLKDVIKPANHFAQNNPGKAAQYLKLAAQAKKDANDYQCYGPEYSVNEVSGNMSVSRSQLHQKLAALTGFSTTGFISMIRLERAKYLLLTGKENNRNRL